MNERRGYYTDTTDEQCSLIEPVVTACKAAHPSVSGHCGRYEMRAIVDAIFDQNRSGCQWCLQRLGAARGWWSGMARVASGVAVASAHNPWASPAVVLSRDTNRVRLRPLDAAQAIKWATSDQHRPSPGAAHPPFDLARSS